MTTTELLAEARRKLVALPSTQRIAETLDVPPVPLMRLDGFTGAHESSDAVYLDGPDGPQVFCWTSPRPRALIVSMLNERIARQKEERIHEHNDRA